MNERYPTIHIVTVFMALAAGMAIGALFLQSPTLDRLKAASEQLRQQTGQLQTDLRETRESLSSTQEQVRKLASLYDRRVAPLNALKLRDRNVLIIQVGDYPNATANAQQSIRLATGAVVATLTFEPSKITEETLTEISRVLSDLQFGANLSPLRSLGGVSVGAEADAMPPIRWVAIIGGYKKPPSDTPPASSGIAGNAVNPAWFEPELIDRLQKQPLLKLVGVETLDAELSSVPIYIQHNIASVDCIDLSVGQIMFPSLFLGDTRSYGLKKSAVAVMPEDLAASL